MAPATEKREALPSPCGRSWCREHVRPLYLRLVNLGAANMPTPAPVLVPLERPVRQMSCREAAARGAPMLVGLAGREWVGRRRRGAEIAHSQGPGCCTSLLVGRGIGGPAAFFAHLTGSIERSDMHKQLLARPGMTTAILPLTRSVLAGIWC
jgi:hypothetical protein